MGESIMFTDTWLRQYRERKHLLSKEFVAEIEKAIKENKKCQAQQSKTSSQKGRDGP